MNNVVLIGRLTKDPEYRKFADTNDGMCSFTLAVDKGLSKQKKAEYEAQNKQTADFPRIICFGKTAELVKDYLQKGLQVAVQGRIQTGSYTNQEGQKVYTTDVIADRVEFLEWKNEQTDTNAGQSDDDFIPFDKTDGYIPF